MNGNQVWKIISVDYVTAVVKNPEEILKKQGIKLPARETTKTLPYYRPEIDTAS